LTRTNSDFMRANASSCVRWCGIVILSDDIIAFLMG